MKTLNVLLFTAVFIFMGCTGSPTNKDGGVSKEHEDAIETDANKKDVGDGSLLGLYSAEFVLKNAKSFGENVLAKKKSLKEVKDKAILENISGLGKASKVYFYSDQGKSSGYQALTVMVCDEYMDDPFDIVKMFYMTFDDKNNFIDQFPLMIYKKYPAGNLKEKSYGEFIGSNTYRYIEEITGEDVEGNDFTTKTRTEYTIANNGKITKKVLPSDKGMENAKTIEVSNVEEFLKAIKSNTIIKLKKGTYDLGEGLGKNIQSDHFEYVDEYNNGELVVYGVENLKITGSSPKQSDCHVYTHPSNGPVIIFKTSKNIYLENLKAGHRPEATECQDGVFVFMQTENINIDNCDIYGCGKEGISTSDTKNFNCTNSHIYSCSANLMLLDGAEEFVFDNCRFSKTTGGVNITKGKNVEFKNCKFDQNQGGNLIQAGNVENFIIRESIISNNTCETIFSFNNYKNVSIYNNEIYNNEADICLEEGLVKTSDNTIKNNVSHENGD